jgi:hypothetical protein
MLNDVSGQKWIPQRGPNIRDFGRHQNSTGYTRGRQEGGSLLIYGEAQAKAEFVRDVSTLVSIIMVSMISRAASRLPCFAASFIFRALRSRSQKWYLPSRLSDLMHERNCSARGWKDLV